MKLFRCQKCAELLYFENGRCESCQHILGYIPELATLSALERDESNQNAWRASDAPNAPYRFCENTQFNSCNWLIRDDSADALCAACRHNRMIPDLTITENLVRWRRFEAAKHRLFYTLLSLRLPTPSRAEDPDNGLAFDFLSDVPNGPKIMTGHENGLITVNLNEADDAEREKTRAAMLEPYRTLLGHLRHESGHFYWERLVRDRGRLEDFRAVFGDENEDYGEALRRNYGSSVSEDWRGQYISSYAAAHPWEDFAETWAHYLHIIDTIETAFAFGISIRPRIVNDTGLEATIDFNPYAAGDIQRIIGAWLPLTFAANEMNRSMGEPDLYPFVLSPEVITKLGFVHDLVRSRDISHRC